MKKNRTRSDSLPAITSRGVRYSRLVDVIAAMSDRMAGRVAALVNQALLFRNWLVGAYLVEFEQNGADRAKYGGRLLATLANDLAARKVAGFSISALERCRRFYVAAPQLGTVIPSTLLTELSDLLPTGIPSTVLFQSYCRRPWPRSSSRSRNSNVRKPRRSGR